jgi:hypothetical protein
MIMFFLVFLALDFFPGLWVILDQNIIYIISASQVLSVDHFKEEFCFSIINQRESFICSDLMIKNREVSIERYFKWWISIKLVCIMYQN